MNKISNSKCHQQKKIGHPLINRSTIITRNRSEFLSSIDTKQSHEHEPDKGDCNRSRIHGFLIEIEED
ncbi:hypothetical protein Hanom_Chr12g01065531 [Helianthus anomalus]